MYSDILSGVFGSGGSEIPQRYLDKTYEDLTARSLEWCWKNTIWLFNIAMDNGPFIDGLPIKTGDFPWLLYVK
jgi:hypothetical protein